MTDQLLNRFQEIRELVIRQAASLAIHISQREITLCAVIMYGIEDDKKRQGGNDDGDDRKAK